MGLLDRILRRTGRDRGMLAEENPQEQETPRLPRPAPTRGTHLPKQPPPTPTTQRMSDPGTTAGTRSYGGQGGTPSTQRIHNPAHPGR